MKSSIRIFLACMLIALGTAGFAGEMSATAPRPAANVWAIPGSPVSAPVVRGLQTFLESDAGQRLQSEIPAIKALAGLDPNNEAHRRIVGVLGLPYQRSESPSANAELAATLATRYREDGRGKWIAGMVASRVAQLAADAAAGRADKQALIRAASELRPFLDDPSSSKYVAEIQRLAETTQEQDISARAHDMAERLFAPPACRSRFGQMAAICRRLGRSRPFPLLCPTPTSSSNS